MNSGILGLSNQNIPKNSSSDMPINNQKNRESVGMFTTVGSTEASDPTIQRSPSLLCVGCNAFSIMIKEFLN